jgi:RNA polymerase sigma factor (sigma-70 family)
MISPGEAAERGGARLWGMNPNPHGPATVDATGAPTAGRPPAGAAEVAVTALYEAHALGMIRLAHIMLGDRQSAEDVVQEAFCGLYRRWSHLSDPGSAVHYVRSAVLNHCRSVLRRRTTSQAPRQATGNPEIVRSAEAAVLTREERDEIMRAVRRLPPRQREALVLRFYLDLSADGRYLAFQQWGGPHETMRVRVLDTTAPGTSVAAAKVIVEFPYQAGTLATTNTFLTPDGTKVVGATSYYPPHHSGPGGYVQITEYSARTGKPLFHEDRFSASIGYQDVLWASPDGSALVISDPRGVKDQYGGRSNIMGVLAGNKFTPIPHGAYTGIFFAW